MNKENKLFTEDFIKVFFTNFFVFTAFYMLLPTLPLYLTEKLNFSDSKAGFIIATYTFSGILIRPIVGNLIDRFGRKKMLQPAVIFFAITFLFYPVSSLVVILLIIRFFHGMLWGMTTTTSSTLIVDIIPKNRRGEGIGIYGLSTTIPMAIAPLAGLFAMNNFGYNTIFYTSFVIAFLAIIMVFIIKYPQIKTNINNKLKLKNIFEPSALPSTLTLILVQIAYGGVITFISIYTQDKKIGNTGMFFLIYALGIAIMRIYGGKLFDKKGPALVSVLGFTLLSAGYFTLTFVNSVYLLSASALFLGLGTGLIFPTLQTMVNNVVPEFKRGAANSTFLTGLDIGIGLGIVLSGWLSDIIGLSKVYFIFGILSLMTLFVFLTFTYRHYVEKCQKAN